MHRRTMSAVALSFVTLIALGPKGFAQSAMTAAQTIAVITGGLNNPRGIAFGPDGALYVTEAGRGGAGACAVGPEGLRCYGATGSITRIDLRQWAVSRVAAGLPSVASVDGSFATGPHDISFRGLGSAFITIGYGGNPADRVPDFGPPGEHFARLIRLTAAGNWSSGVDLGSYEAAANPTGDEIDTNPYGVLALPARQIVADAGANALNQVAANGEISTLAVFPDGLAEAPDFLGLPPGTLIPLDTVPTSVAQGPDGAFYVGQLTGFPFPAGGAKIFRVPSHGGAPEVFAEGFTAVIDLAFGPDGSLYVLEIAKNGLLAAFIDNDWTGALIRLAPDGTRSEIGVGSFFAPGGLAVSADGTVYVTNNSVFSGIGEVVRVEP